MADQGRWFKVWTSILDDPDFQELTLEDVGRWALLGAMTKLVGDHGVLTINGTGRRLCQVLQVASLDDARTSLQRLPNVRVDDVKNRYGDITVTLTVTFKNWRKYQEDSTVAQRQRMSRSKKRREEMREKTRKDPPFPPHADAPTDRPDDLSIKGGSDRSDPEPDWRRGTERLGAIMDRWRQDDR